MTKNKLDSIRDDYELEGFVALPGFLNQEEVQHLREELQAFQQEKLRLIPPEYIFYEGTEKTPDTLKQLQDLQVYSNFFRSVLEKGRFKEMAEALLREKAIGKNLEYFNKPAKIGKATPAHQDAYYFMLNPPNAVTMWLALEEADEANGCIRYIPGSHLGPMRSHGFTQTLGFSQGITDYNQKDHAKEIPIRAKPGDLLIHHGMMIHRADGNKSPHSRKALGFVYFGASAKEDVVAKAAYQQKLKERRSSL